MKERVALARNVEAGDIAASAFRPNYMYLHEEGVTLYFEPNFITPLRLVYPGDGAADGEGTIVMSPAMANRFRLALAEAMLLCKTRMETPFIPPAPAAPEVPGNQGGNK